MSAASYNFASAATRGLLPKSKEESTQKKLDAVWGVVQQVVEVRGPVRGSVRGWVVFKKLTDPAGDR